MSNTNKKRMLKTRTGRAKPGRQVHANSFDRGVPSGKRNRGPDRNERLPFIPPEDWHEPVGRQGYSIVVQPPGEGYRHVATPDEVRGRLAELPAEFVEPLEVVQFSRVTRKKRSFPCYGMQWGTAIYLYSIEVELVEYFPRPPMPQMMIEARMYGGRWIQEGTAWRLEWSESSIRDFYLNNILIHELGHLLDLRNNGYAERERFAEWFAVEYGYRPTQPRRQVKKRRRVVRRHHAK